MSAKASVTKKPSGARTKATRTRSVKAVKKSAKKTGSTGTVMGTVVIDGVKVKILKPTRKKGAISDAKIRKAIAAVQKAKM